MAGSHIAVAGDSAKKSATKKTLSGVAGLASALGNNRVVNAFMYAGQAYIDTIGMIPDMFKPASLVLWEERWKRGHRIAGYARFGANVVGGTIGRDGLLTPFIE